MDYRIELETAKQERADKHIRLVECLAEIMILKDYIELLENYCDGLESLCPVDHKQRRPRPKGWDHV